MTGVYVGAGSLTRGYGLLEGLLARRRAVMADSLLPASGRRGRILDVGCGCEPYFLARTEFVTKVGVDKVVGNGSAADSTEYPSIRLMQFDVDASSELPFRSESFDAVTMLAVFEHLRVERLIILLNEVQRVLKNGGVYIMTTPAGWTGPILTILKRLRLVSPVEIDEHQDAYSRAKIRRVLRETHLAGHAMRFGSFELFMNTWLLVRKEGRASIVAGPRRPRRRRDGRAAATPAPAGASSR